MVSNDTTSKPNFIKIRPVVLESKHADGRMYTISPIRVSFMHTVQIMDKKQSPLYNLLRDKPGQRTVNLTSTTQIHKQTTLMRNVGPLEHLPYAS
jgi:hypothetical protein